MKSMRTARSLALLLILAGCGNQQPPVRLFVAASLGELASGWQRNYPGPGSLELHAGASRLLANQIMAGAEADFLLAAGPMAIADLMASGRVARVDSTYLSNDVVMVCASGVTPPAEVLGISDDRFTRIAVADWTLAPAGEYARQGLSAAGIWDAVRERLVILSDVRAVLTAVRSGAADIGLVYATDARTAPDLMVWVPDGQYFPVVRYPLVMLAPETEARIAFWDYLHAPAVHLHAGRQGFR